MKSRTSQLPVVLSAAFAVASFPALAGARPAPGGVAAPSYYQRALNRFHQDDCAGALELLNHAPAGSGVEARTRADLLNLRGEIHLKQGQLEFARKEFAQAVALNPQLWSGRFNLAEVALRRRRYADSQRQFASLVEHTSRFDHAEERSRAEAGLRLAKAGDSQPQPELGGSATMAVMQLLPAQKLATHHAEAATPAHPGVVQSAHRPPAPSVNPVLASQSAPPSPSLAPAEDETDDIAPGLLARKRPAPKPRPTPQPADQSSPPSDSATPSPASAAASSATPAPSATPSPDPATPAFLQKYESAYIKFLEKDFAGAQAILTEADAIQANQPASIDLRNKIFSYYYKIAYGKYSDKDYTGAQTALDDADSVEKDQPDSLNLRGLIFSRQRVFDQAEVMFKKAVQADPSFWAAKFNMAELPFTYRNYTVARSRYEQLLSETNAAKQPREAELTQFKVFLTLLLEGKESAARAFMDHFSFTGATPARYYCQAALDFYAGNTDKATESIAEARKDFPAQIEAIFADSFYRVGWLTDPTRPALASASSSPAEAPEPPVSPSPSLAGSSPSRGPATAAVKSPSPTPMLMAAASPSPTPVVSASPSPKQAAVATSTPSPVPTATAKPTATPAPTATATPAPTATARPTATATPAPTATPTATVKPTATATATPAPTATPTATVKPTATATPAPTATVKPTVTPTPAPTATVKPTVTATPAPTPTVRPTLAATATPSPSATATPSPTATAKPASVAALTPTPTLRPSASPTPTPAAAAAVTQEPSPAESESPAETPEAENSPQEDLIRLFAMLLVPLYLIGSWFYVVRRALAIKAEKRKPALHYGGRKQSSDDSDTPR